MQRHCTTLIADETGMKALYFFAETGKRNFFDEATEAFHFVFETPKTKIEDKKLSF